MTSEWDTEELLEGDEKVEAVRHMFDAIAPKYDRLNRIISFRLDVRWRKRAVRDLALARGARVLDLASGTGDLCIDLARVGIRPISMDLSFGMLSADRSGAPRVQTDILRLPVPDGSVDGVTCGFALRNLADLPTFFAEIGRVVRPGGRIALLDVSTPRNPVVRWGNNIYFGHVVPRIGALLSDGAAYRYLPKSVAYLPTPEAMVAGLKSAGFTDVTHSQLTGGLTQLMVATRSAHRERDVFAITRPLAELTDVAVDLNDFASGDGRLFVRDGIGVAGRGTAATFDLDDATTALASIGSDTTVEGHGPLALGVIPFRPGAPATVAVPQVVVRKSSEHSPSITVVGTDEADAYHLLGGVVAALGFTNGPAADPTSESVTASSYVIQPGVDIDHYLAAVTEARNATRSGALVKAVIARPIIVTADRPIDVHAVLRRLRATFGSSYRYSIDGLIGASPELLVEVDGPVVRSHPLAGTAARTGDAENDARIAAELIASTKNQIEHRVVIDVVHDTLLPWASYLDWEPEPSIVTVANVQHLGTRMEGMLSQPGPSVIELARALCPTPALGGHPRAEAIELIERVEGFERGRYGGAVGWVDSAGNGTWAVAIRCAELSDDGCSARLVAGGGIVADSEPLAELAETQAKFQAMLSAIIRP